MMLLVFEVEVVEVQKGHAMKKKRHELWDVKTHQKLIEEAQAMVDDEKDHEDLKKDSD